MRLAPKRFWILWLFFLLVCRSTWAQQPVIAHVTGQQEFSIEQISLEQGLSQGMVFSMLQDTLGYIWVGTKEGLNRYSGNGFKVFRHNPNDSLSISDNIVNSLALDKKQRLWAGTTTQGLNLFDPSTESFIHFKHEPGNPNSIPTNNIGVVCKDGSGNLIFELPTIGHMVVIEKPDRHKNPKNAFVFKPIAEIYPQLKNIPLHLGEVVRLNFSKDGDLWFKANDTLYGYTAEMLRSGAAALKFFYPSAENIFKEIRPPFLFDAWQNRTFITSHGNVLKQFDSVSKKFIPVLQLPHGYTFHASVFIDRDNFLWSWLPDNRMAKVNMANGEMTVINIMWRKIDQTAIQPYRFAFEDVNGNLWLSSGGYGLFKVSARNKLFKHKKFIPPNSIEPIWRARIEQTGIKAAYNPVQLQQLNNCLNKLEQKGMVVVCPDHFTNFALDKNGLFWTSFYDPKVDKDAIACLNSFNDTYQLFRDSSGSGSVRLGSPVFLDNNGALWFGEQYSAHGVNLYHLNQQQNKIEVFRFPVEVLYFEHQFISDYYQDADGVFWLATTQGLFAFQPQTKQWQHFTNKPGDTSSLSKDLLLSLCPDPREPNRYIWVGTEGAGLNKFDKQKQTFTRFEVKDGLPNNVIYGIQSDTHNNLWISTNNGICQFNPQTLQTRNFTQADGLVSNEFNRFEFSKTTDGTLYFGSPSGVSYFQPNDFYNIKEPSAVVINKLKLLNKEVAYRQPAVENNSFKLSAPVEYCKELVFNYNQRMITLGFAVLDLTVPTQNRFKYRLEGFDNDWIEAGTKNEATYTNLSPGSYTFKVMGCNSSDIWSTQPAFIKITVLPPWWGTWWFRTIMILVFAGGLYALYRYRLSKVLELERVRNRIAQDLHDEIGSTLSSISLFSAAIQKNPNGLSKQNHHILNKITQSTTKMMETMNDMVWTIKADNDNFEQVVNRMRAFAVNMTEAKGIELHFNTNALTQKLLLNMEQRKNIYLIFKETINNAVKYSGCTHLYVTISNSGNLLEMRIKDNGAGFELEAVAQNNLQFGGNGLRGIQSRAKSILGHVQILSAEGVGTEVVFSMALS